MSIMSFRVRAIFGLVMACAILVGLWSMVRGNAIQPTETASVNKDATKNSSKRTADDKTKVLTLSISEVNGFPYVHIEWWNLPQRSVLVLTQHHENKNLDLVDDMLNYLAYPMVNYPDDYEPPVWLGPWVAAIGIDSEGEIFVPIVATGSKIEAFAVRAIEIRIAEPIGKPRWPRVPGNSESLSMEDYPRVQGSCFFLSMENAPHELTLYRGDDLHPKSVFVDTLSWQTFQVPQRTRFSILAERRDIFAQSAPLALHQPAVRIKPQKKP